MYGHQAIYEFGEYETDELETVLRLADRLEEILGECPIDEDFLGEVRAELKRREEEEEEDDV